MEVFVKDFRENVLSLATAFIVAIAIADYVYGGVISSIIEFIRSIF